MISVPNAAGTGRQQPVSAVVLAAGRSQRMGNGNKLLANIDGKPVLRYVVEAVLASGVHAVIVVTGHQAHCIRRALSGCPVRFAHNRHFADGLSTSLRVGVAAVRVDSTGVLCCLGDMPRVGPSELRRLVDAFTERGGRNICVPVRRGRRGNPVLWPRILYPELMQLTGELGARSLLTEYAELVHRVEVDSDGIFDDIDTSDDLREARGRRSR